MSKKLKNLIKILVRHASSSWVIDQTIFYIITVYFYIVYDSILSPDQSPTSGQMTQSPANSNTNISRHWRSVDAGRSLTTKHSNVSRENFVKSFTDIIFDMVWSIMEEPLGLLKLWSMLVAHPYAPNFALSTFSSGLQVNKFLNLSLKGQILDKWIPSTWNCST